MARNPQSTDITPQAAAQFWQATLDRDPRADGKFFLAVRSTHIYCRPTCPARRPLRQNVVFFRTMQEAEKNGYRPCLRCRPQEQLEAVSLVKQAAKLLGNSSEEDSIRLGPIATQLHASTAKLRRVFHRVTGLSPREFAQAARLEKFKKMLREGADISEALYACGYGSPSRVYEKTNSQLGMTPASYRKGGAGMKIAYSVAASSLGKVLVAGTERGISAVYLGDDERTLVGALEKEYPRADIARSSASNEIWLKEILSRVEGHAPSKELPLDVQATAFQRRVWQELQKIPPGATRTYTQVARALGRPNAVRAVARACATNPTSIVVPCHRVIRTDGELAGYRWGLQRKQKLLEREGARA
ncbi:MAG TPA: bifunctional DNA-binding transcriptional regulator/O6-methylguanine-DNA methyltransferase Ada [Candidatus Limnocylindrales bacterium]|nr:bifunctional DNA-binding transcriptional regulator/O6-methylguanine-DNA methyltransferase Ada [Candidatus Limnocylindrales bacterium]